MFWKVIQLSETKNKITVADTQTAEETSKFQEVFAQQDNSMLH